LHPEVRGITSRPQSHEAEQGHRTRNNDAQGGPADCEAALATNTSTSPDGAHR
jgi:hypothetical protein